MWEWLKNLRKHGCAPAITNADDLFFTILAAWFGGFTFRGFIAQYMVGNTFVSYTAAIAYVVAVVIVAREFLKVWRNRVADYQDWDPSITEDYDLQLPTGLLPPLPENEAPRLKLSSFLREDYKATVIPQAFGYTDVATWPMYLNDRLGTCTAADVAHNEQVISKYGQGLEWRVSDDDVLAFYKLCSGYDGTPATDRGAVLQKVQDQYRKVGIAGRKIAAFFEVDNSDLAEVRTALYLFGGVAIGFPFPRSAMKQFNANKAWDVDTSLDNSINGGHDVLLVGIDETYFYVVTWGKLQKVTRRFWSKYMCSRNGEGWARASQEWINDNTGFAPHALDVATLNEEYQRITGGKISPFTVVTPAPAPAPVPVPPASGVSSASRELAVALHKWMDAYPNRESGAPEWLFVKAAKAWLRSRGL